MALDNAQFMSELSIVDPPGTDPLSEGDDQIRTAKRTQLQSFPNVDKAVVRTADEMNDMALQSGSNVFSGVTNAFNDRTLRFTATTADEDAGPLFISEIATLRWDIRRLATNLGGDLAINRYDSNGTFIDVPWKLTATRGVQLMSGGRAADPSYSFSLSPGTGMFETGTDLLGFATGGVERMRIFSQGIISIADGAASAPPYAFAAGTTMGMYRVTDNQLGFGVGNIGQMIIKVDTIGMPRLGTGPGGALVSGDLYVKQSQAFAPTELIVGMQP